MHYGLAVEVVEHEKQRYDTVGDWYTDKEGKLRVTVSRLSDWRHEFLVAMHEQIEQALCFARRIKEEAVTKFDIEHEKAWCSLMHEPGDCPLAPYRREHFFAESVERLLAQELAVEWSEYEKEVCSLRRGSG